MNDTVTIKLSYPYFEEEVLIDDLGYSVDEWHNLDLSEKEAAIINFVDLDFDDD
jgi:hypothetical protein